MKINGIEIKRYRARVRARNIYTTLQEPAVSPDGFKIVEGYISIAAIVIPDGGGSMQLAPVFVAEEVDFHRLATSGFGKSIFHPVTYSEGEFELLGEVD